MKTLLVEPNYYTQYPPLGLLKLSTLYKQQGHEVQFIRGLKLVTKFVPEEIKITSLFTWAWKPVWEAVAFYRALFPKAKVSLGGIYASLTPEHARQSGAHEVFTGLVREAEDLMPGLLAVPEWLSDPDRSASIPFASRLHPLAASARCLRSRASRSRRDDDARNTSSSGVTSA
jgi:hypothetical protein